MLIGQQEFGSASRKKRHCAQTLRRFLAVKRSHWRTIRGEDRVAKYGAVGALPKLIEGFEQAKRASSAGEIVELITEFDLPREAIPMQWLNEAAVWDALLERMPVTAMVRNLGKMTSIGQIGPFSDAKGLIIRKLRDEKALKRARIHLLAVLVAQKIYAHGYGDKGALAWCRCRLCWTLWTKRFT